MDRFNYREKSQSIYDGFTGYSYSSLDEITKLLNEQEYKNNKLIESGMDDKIYLDRLAYIMRKHNIDSLEKLDKCLLVGRTW